VVRFALIGMVVLVTAGCFGSSGVGRTPLAHPLRVTLTGLGRPGKPTLPTLYAGMKAREQIAYLEAWREWAAHREASDKERAS
jgi:hypothetical protein